jgi:hypothetical protein
VLSSAGSGSVVNMKQSQMLLAVLVLAVMVFIVTFAMNYLGGGGTPTQTTPQGPTGPRRELLFASKLFPPDGLSMVDRENHKKGHFDYWFVNPHDASLKVGLIGQSCKCTEVRLSYLPEDGPRRIVCDAVALLGAGLAGAVPAVALQALATPELQKGASEHEILKDKEAVNVPAKAVGWVRLMFKGEKPGPMGLTAVVWTENKETGARTSLDARVAFHDPMRLKPGLQVGTFKEADLANGVTRYILVSSPTRLHLDLDVKAAYIHKGKPQSDPFHVGKPEPLDRVELDKLQRELVATSQSDPMEGGPPGQLLCGYRIPVTFKAVSDDGETPFDLGPFRRRVVINCKDIEGDPRSVVILGRVLGLIELGTDEDSGDINFRTFKSSQGKQDKISLSTEVDGVNLEVDPHRTSPFLSANLLQLSAAEKGRKHWRLTVRVLPGKAFGPFPRRDNPAYEDCAVYLIGTVPGKKPQSIRIAVQGTATEG